MIFTTTRSPQKPYYATCIGHVTTVLAQIFHRIIILGGDSVQHCPEGKLIEVAVATFLFGSKEGDLDSET